MFQSLFSPFLFYSRVLFFVAHRPTLCALVYICVIFRAQNILLVKNENERLGMHIKGGLNGQRGNPLDPADEGVFVSKINSSGAARRDGRLKVRITWFIYQIRWNFNRFCHKVCGVGGIERKTQIEFEMRQTNNENLMLKKANTISTI